MKRIQKRAGIQGGVKREPYRYPYKRGHLVRLRGSKVTTKDDGEPWYPGDRRDRN